MPILIDEDNNTSSSNNKPRSGQQNAAAASQPSDDDDGDSFTDAMDDDDDFFAVGADSGPAKNRLQPLIPDDYGDEALASIKFAEEFSNRYGHPHPGFFPGTLDDALRESCLKPAREVGQVFIFATFFECSFTGE